MVQESEAGSVPAFEVLVNGSDLPPAAKGEVTRLTTEESLDRAGTFAIELSNWDLTARSVTWSDDPLFEPGAAVEIRLGYAGSMATVLAGEITGLELSYAERGRSVVTVRGYDRLHRFRRGRRTRSYLQVKDSDAARQIAADLGLTPDVEDSGVVHPYLLQSNQTDIDFLLARARAIGYELTVDDKTLRFRKVKCDRGEVLTLDAGQALLAVSAYLSTADQVSKVVVRGWDPKVKQPVVGQAAASDLTRVMGNTSGPSAAQKLFGDRTLTLADRAVGDQAEADQLARGVLDDVALSYVVAEGTAIGNPAIRVGTVVRLAGLGTRFSGLYYLTHVAHVWEDRFVTLFHARRNAA